MSARAEALVERYEQTNSALIALIESCSAAQWKATCAGEGWSVGVTAHHVAVSTRPVASIVEAIAAGGPLPPLTRADIDRMNAEHAVQAANCTAAETVALLREQGAAAANVLRSLSDAELDRSLPMPLMGGAPVSAAQFAEAVLIGHAQGHSASIKQALGT